jgi:hypothetical protein
MARSAAVLRLSALAHSPVATRASMVFATSTVLSIPYRRTASSPRSPVRADSLGRPSIVSTSVSEV